MDKQICSMFYSGVLPSNKNGQTTDAHKNIRLSEKKARHKTVHSVWSHDVQKQAKLINGDQFVVGGGGGGVTDW